MPGQSQLEVLEVYAEKRNVAAFLAMGSEETGDQHEVFNLMFCRAIFTFIFFVFGFKSKVIYKSSAFRRF